MTAGLLRGTAGKVICPCDDSDLPTMLRVINMGATAYRGIIPSDRWHEPYMSLDELRAEIAAGVRFTGYADHQGLVGVMGVQAASNVTLIRHAYVLPERQGLGVGSELLTYLRRGNEAPVLIGTWRAATWAIRFYERHGFQRVPETVIAALLRAYWDVPERQVETSVVLASPALSELGATALIDGVKK